MTTTQVLTTRNELDNFLNMLPRRTGVPINLNRHMAKLMLDRYTENRSTRWWWIRDLTKFINEGTWNNDGNPITFNSNNIPINGFHRLQAFLLSDKDTLDVNVCAGMDDSIITTGVKRTPSDVLDYHKIKNSVVTAAGLKLAYSIENGVYGERGASSRVFSRDEMVDYFKSDAEFWVEVASITKRFYKESGHLMNPAMVFALYARTQKIDPTDSTEFFTRFSSGVGLEPGSPILALRSKFIKHRATRDPKHRVDQKNGILYFMVAWNKFRNGEQVKMLKLPESNEPIEMI